MTTDRIVVATREANHYHDSYFYATFYNPGQIGLSEFSEEMIGSTAFAGGCYNLTITATADIHDRYLNHWLPKMSAWLSRETLKVGDLVYSPNARKYKSLGQIKSIYRDPYDSREWLYCIAFPEGTTSMRISKIRKLHPFVQNL
jgi:hypothetical protein